MIGIFGLRRNDPAAPADLASLAGSVPKPYVVDAASSTGGAVGLAAHRSGFYGDRSKAAAEAVDVVVTGAIFNLEDFKKRYPGAVSTTRLIALLYEAGRLSELVGANGQFAAAIYDRRNHRLTLITDRLATTAIHVWSRDGEIVFATQLYTLRADTRVPRKANSAAIAQLFTMQRTIGDTAPIQGVVSLPAACIATYDDKGAKQHVYWNLVWESGRFSEDEGAIMLADALRRAVARQSVGRCSGLLLSGGVDSRMVLAAAVRRSLSCWTTASYEGNPELALAKRTAAMFDAEHHTLIVEPAATLNVHDDTVVHSGGLYPASISMSAFMPEVGKTCDIALSGHGLDYTLRGYYLPTHFAEFGGSRTRLPLLKSMPVRPAGRDVFNWLRQGPPRSTVERIVRPACADAWWSGQEAAVDRVLWPWLESREPYNAWDAFILHAVNKHYAFTAMMSVRAATDMAIPAFDNEVMQVYLGMPPAWRVSGRLVHKALRHLAPAAARLPNANTHFRADLNSWLEVAGLFLRAGFRHAGLLSRPKLPSQSHSAGSWQNLDVLYRQDPGHRQRFMEIRGRLDALTFGLLSEDQLAACIDEHLDGRAKHTKLLRQLLTHDAWVRRFGIESHD